MPIVFHSINSNISTSSSSWENIPGLSVNLNDLAYAGSKEALVTLTVPSPYATGNNYPAIDFAITMNGNVLSSGSVSYSDKNPATPGRVPFSIQVLVNLSNHSQLGSIQAQWKGARGSTAHIDSPCSISAVVN
ncbi:hypothetical protein [Pectobacterium brasiliense]|uniref:hypothetical protein n=1 Tax=Pectobacterium brasiliense TaxID=180957 RepID=UPI00103A9386|nr:hypothetical protein [Pectobacterium brasiliense]MBN3230110.1 hypothetical protein [Pectobacterium brasiliense]